MTLETSIPQTTATDDMEVRDINQPVSLVDIELATLPQPFTKQPYTTDEVEVLNYVRERSSRSTLLHSWRLECRKRLASDPTLRLFDRNSTSLIERLKYEKSKKKKLNEN